MSYGIFGSQKIEDKYKPMYKEKQEAELQQNIKDLRELESDEFEDIPSADSVSSGDDESHGPYMGPTEKAKELRANAKKENGQISLARGQKAYWDKFTREQDKRMKEDDARRDANALNSMIKYQDRIENRKKRENVRYGYETGGKIKKTKTIKKRKNAKKRKTLKKRPTMKKRNTMKKRKITKNEMMNNERKQLSEKQISQRQISNRIV